MACATALLGCGAPADDPHELTDSGDFAESGQSGGLGGAAEVADAPALGDAQTYGVCTGLAARGLGAYGNPTGRPLGGGEGYGDWVTPVDPPVENLSDLLDELADATSGEVVYVADDAEINLGNNWHTLIPEGVTLASGRGNNGSLGALLYTNDESTTGKPEMFSAQAFARITGLRIRGPLSPNRVPTPETCAPCEVDEATGLTTTTCEQCDTRGIEAIGNDVEIDNNDIWNFPRSAVLLSAPGSRIHHNYIHHTSRRTYFEGCDQMVEDDEGYVGGPYQCGLSYGISVGNVDAPNAREAALIEANVFSHHRHAINGGHPSAGYRAQFNVVREEFYSHPFDMHGGGEEEFCLYEEKDCSVECLWPHPYCHGFVAGKRIEIFENTFLTADCPDELEPCPSVKIRAKPQDTAWMLCNRFSRSEVVETRQIGIPGFARGEPEGNFDATSNYYNTTFQPYTLIRSDSGGGYDGDYLGVDPYTGQLKMYPWPYSSRTRWRVTWDNDIVRIQTLAPGAHYLKYLDISTTTGWAKLYADPNHTGTKWQKSLYQDGSGRYARLISRANGSYNGQYFTLDLSDADIYTYWNQNYAGARWIFDARP